MTVNRSNIKLWAPEEYINSSIEDRKRVINGCGPSDWKTIFISDNILWLDISEACNIHDWMYEFGETIEDKELADRVFMNNMIRLIDNGTNFKILKRIRLYIAHTYYKVLRYYGGPYYWKNKNLVTNLL